MIFVIKIVKPSGIPKITITKVFSKALGKNFLTPMKKPKLIATKIK
ncbi:hypothetical protein C2W58_03528 [Bacillus pumilus]|uniref:Uncharacterized protein n=1 Tax=Bacillus pumilus TaxID=1408 RepID=A0AB34QUW1_BACPU|nr:hypothetical protein B4127_0611 [Bacillus pumilus]RAP11877.1 hypothetical protein C2W58_03528 [Bacillus pumilus]